MTTMLHHGIIKCFKIGLVISPDPLFYTFYICSLSYIGYRYRHDNKDERILLVDMKHSQPHMTLYRAYIFLSWCGRIDRSLESLMMILLSTYLDSLSPPYYGGLTIIL